MASQLSFRLVRFVYILGLTSFVNLCNGHKMLFLSSESHSHVIYMSSIAEECAKEGSNVSIILSSATPNNEINKMKSVGIQVLTYKTKRRTSFYKDPGRIAIIAEAFLGRNHTYAQEVNAKNIRSETSDIWEMMDDSRLIEIVNESHFDLVVVDGFYYGFGRYILPYKLNLPYVTVTSMFYPWANRIPALPSFVPLSTSSYTQEMSFMERLDNTWSFAKNALLPWKPPAAVDETWARYLPGIQPPTNIEIVNRGEITLYNMEPLMGYPVPLMPNTISVGGLTNRPPKPLSLDLMAILKNSKNGVVFISFGTVLSFIPESYSWKLYKAFDLVKHTIIFRYDGPKRTFPSNVHHMKWLPQNDLLAHPKVKVFVTHCGSNGLMEALYNGVPMVGVPVYGDQVQGAARVQYNGYGRVFHLPSDPPEKLADLIHEVVQNQTYRENIQRASAIYRDRPDSPRQRAAYWIKHVLKYGSKHLRSYANDMPLHQYWMLDIIGFLLLVSVIVIASAFSLLYLLISGLRSFLRHINRPPKIKQN